MGFLDGRLRIAIDIGISLFLWLGHKLGGYTMAWRKKKAEPEPAPVVVPEPEPEPDPAAPGNTVIVTDARGVRHEAVVIRDPSADERPLFVRLRDVVGTELLVRHDPNGARSSWRLR